MKENILKNYKISKVNKETSDIVVSTTIKDFESNTIRYNKIKTDGVIITRYNLVINSNEEESKVIEKESKVIGSSVTIVDSFIDTVSSSDTCLRSVLKLNRRLVYSEKWVTEKDIERVSQNCHTGTISGFTYDNEIEIDGEYHRLLIIDDNFENKFGFDGDSIIKTDGQVYEVDGRMHVRNASYIIEVRHDLPPICVITDIYVDFNRATAKTLKDIKDDFRMASYEAKRKFK